MPLPIVTSVFDSEWLAVKYAWGLLKLGYTVDVKETVEPDTDKEEWHVKGE